MKYLSTILSVTILLSFGGAYSQTLNEHEDKVSQYSKTVKDLVQRSTDLESRISDLDMKLENLKTYQENFNSNVAAFQKEVDEYLQNNNSIFSKLGPKNSLFRCLKKEAEERSEFVALDNCLSSYKSKMTQEEKAHFDSWKNKIGLHPKSVEAFIKSNQNERDSLASNYEKYQKDIIFVKGLIEKEENSAAFIKIRHEDQKILSQYGHIAKCDSNTPEINLEKENPFPGAKFRGPFVGVPRDNQDGLGTCYSNVAKNLIVAGTKGHDVASFLDLAIVYKGEEGLAGAGLDAGKSCDVISQVRQKGYCPQKFAPSETGESNPYIEGLFGNQKNTVWDQSVMNKLVADFLAKKKNLELDNPAVAKNIFDKMRSIVSLVRRNPNIRFPTPIISQRIPSERELLEQLDVYKKKKPSANTYLMKKEYDERYKKFQVQFSKSILEGKSVDTILNHYDSIMGPFLDKYDLQESARKWKNDFKKDISDKLNAESVARIRENFNFMKKILKKEDVNDSEFLEYCENFGHSLLSFAGSLKPLIDHLVQVGGRADLLADSKGKLRSAIDIMQLAVAPACINEDARKPLKNQLICEEGREMMTNLKAQNIPHQEKIKKMRDVVVTNLVQGYAVGNTFERHINTIVGMRFNSDRNECEYLIRESQNGRSDWQSENRIFQKIEALTEVRRK